MEWCKPLQPCLSPRTPSWDSVAVTRQMIDTLTLVLISTYTVYILAVKHTKPVQLAKLSRSESLFFLQLLFSVHGVSVRPNFHRVDSHR